MYVKMLEDKKPVRVFLVAPECKARGGREQLSGLLMESLRVVSEDQLEVYRMPHDDKPARLHERIMGRIDGVTSAVEKDLVSRLKDKPPDCVFIDGSNLGRIVRLLKNANDTVPIVTFYHNVEARFFFDAFRASPSLRALGVLVANIIAERWATRYSDHRIMLNNRDSHQLAKLYGREGTELLPMVVPDFYDPTAVKSDRPLVEQYALFVGGAFYANVEGLAWFAENVALRSPILTVVIGRGMEAYRSRLEQWGGVRVVGSVDDLAPWYAHAQIIVAPILSGSGMKTKTAEAFMHGKPIAGTKEAFEGYRMDITDAVVLCETPEDFLQALEDVNNSEADFKPELRSEYIMTHSEKAMQTRLCEFLKSMQRNARK